MSKRYLTEAEAWERIAEAYVCDETAWGQIACTGLCWAIDVLNGRHVLAPGQYGQMRYRLTDTFSPDPHNPFLFWWRRDREGNNQRIYACLLLAILAREDAK